MAARKKVVKKPGFAQGRGNPTPRDARGKQIMTPRRAGKKVAKKGAAKGARGGGGGKSSG